MDLGLRHEIQERNLRKLAACKAFQFSETFFPYTSGQIGNYYVNSENVMRDGIGFHTAIIDMAIIAGEIEEENKIDFGFISGGETRDWIFSYPLAYRMCRPHFSVYKDGKVLGADIKGKRGIHVADLNNEGSSPRDLWMPAIRKAGGEVRQILFYVDRLEDGVEAMKELGLESHAAVPMDAHAWDFLREKGIVTSEIYQASMQRLEDRAAWAREMLRSGKGIERLAELAREPKTTDKAKKILNAGYPDMKDEMLERLGAKGISLA